jgi:hypothetical protein
MRRSPRVREPSSFLTKNYPIRIARDVETAESGRGEGNELPVMRKGRIVESAIASSLVFLEQTSYAEGPGIQFSMMEVQMK